MSTTTTSVKFPRTAAPALRRMVKIASRGTRKDYAGIYPVDVDGDTRYCACSGYHFVRLAADVSEIPRAPGENLIDFIQQYQRHNLDFCRLLDVPAVKSLRDFAASNKGAPVMLCDTDGRGILLNPKYIIDMLCILGDCDVYAAPKCYDPVYFVSRAGLGDGFILPIRPQTEDEARAVMTAAEFTAWKADRDSSDLRRREASARRALEATEREAAEREAAERAAREAAEKLARYHGFLDDATPVYRGRVYKLLEQRYRYGSTVATLREHIDRWIAQGEEPVTTTYNYGPRGKYKNPVTEYGVTTDVKMPDGTVQRSYYPLKKMAYDYACYVHHNKASIFPSADTASAAEGRE